MRVLFCSALPDKEAVLGVDVERRQIEAASMSAAVEYVPSPAVTLGHLIHDLQRVRPTVLHFSGHGGRVAGGADAVFLLGDSGLSEELDADGLDAVLMDAGSSVRLVVLNACHSLPLADVAARRAGLAIGMSRAIADAAAIRFSQAFYGAVSAARPVKEAFDAGCKAAVLTGHQRSVPREVLTPAHGTAPPVPVLVARSDVDPARLALTAAASMGLDNRRPR